MAIDQAAEMAEIVLHHWARDVTDSRYPTSVRCGAEGCEWVGRFPGDISDHVAAVLSAAGYGLIRDALQPFRDELEACGAEIQRLRRINANLVGE